MATVDDLRERSVQCPTTHCWLWKGARSAGAAAIWTFDHARGEKRVMPGARATWNIAHGAAPLLPLVFMACGNRLCVNPAHLREARSRAEYGAHVRRAGWLVGVAVPQKVEALRKARVAKGVIDTPKQIVQAIRSMPASVSHAEVARQLDVNVRRVYSIRSGRTHREAA